MRVLLQVVLISLAIVHIQVAVLQVHLIVLVHLAIRSLLLVTAATLVVVHQAAHHAQVVAVDNAINT